MGDDETEEDSGVEMTRAMRETLECRTNELREREPGLASKREFAGFEFTDPAHRWNKSF
jgi:hypothetical protein